MGGGPITAFSGSPALGILYITAAGRVGVNPVATLSATGGADFSFCRVNGLAGTYRGFSMRTGVLARWFVSANSTAEAGADAGSDFAIRAYNDAGGAIDFPLIIIRAAGGVITFAVARPVVMGALTAASLTHGSATLLITTASLTNGAGASAGTLTNAPAAGNPTKWVLINDNGTTRRIPAW
jgi:hypothetical protein